jgi:glycosyltransferase involved in cell wall biosynthesis
LTTGSGAPLIAIDARLVGYAAGIARYASLLAQALVQLEGPERYMVVYGKHALRIENARTRRVFTPPHNRFERWTLPIELLVRQPTPSVLHSVDHVAPRWGMWRSVVTLHDLAFLVYPETHTAASRAYYAASGESARHAGRVIAVSQRTASDAVRLLGVDPVRVRVVPEAAAPVFTHRTDAEFLGLARRLRLQPDLPYVLFVGTLEPRKNVLLLLEAFSILRQQFNARLLVVGARGWLDEPIFAAHARLGLHDSARFLGPLDENDLAALYSHAAAFVLPSLYEGFGLPVLEAMACGAPVICSNAGPLPEVAGDAAVLLPPEDPSAWAVAMLHVLTDPGFADVLRQKGFAHTATFSWQRAALATRDVYREAILA